MPALDEFAIIRKYFQAGEQDGTVVLGVGDDGAVLQPPEGRQLVLCADWLGGGSHFPEHGDPAQIAARALAVNVSDLAAMGAEPLWFTLMLSLPQADEGWLAPFSGALLQCARRHGITLVGGDTVRGPLGVGIQAAGAVPPGGALLRSGGRPGDLLAVTGALGCGAAAVTMGLLQRPLQSDAEREIVRRYWHPQPPLQLAVRGRHLINAAIDISDGLVADCGHLAAASGLQAAIDAQRVPRHPALDDAGLAADAALRLALGGGDDYELCLAYPQHSSEPLAALAAACGAALHPLGRLQQAAPKAPAVLLQNAPADMPARAGFRHF